ncbi:MAG: TlpA disulfide reductase family protein [Gammaproteobacteria bacterium]|nr:TlpA disulfide reductase family protein [Gammaproteobacteria bacterium]
MNKIVTKSNLLILIALACLGSMSALIASSDLLGKPAPDFTLRSDQGDNKKLSEYRGKVVLINFWASWCGPCQQELPKLSELRDLHDEYDFELLAVNIDEEPEKAIRLAKKLGINFPILFDESKKVSKLYDIDAMPMTILVDRNGEIRYMHRGFKESYLSLYQQQIKHLKFE